MRCQYIVWDPIQASTLSREDVIESSLKRFEGHKIKKSHWFHYNFTHNKNGQFEASRMVVKIPSSQNVLIIRYSCLFLLLLRTRSDADGDDDDEQDS